MTHQINEFLEKYMLGDPYLSSYDDDTLEAITDILGGHGDKHVYSKNGVVLLYIGLYNRYIATHLGTAEKYYLMAAEYHNLHAKFNLGHMYKELSKYDLAEKYFLMVAEQNYSHASRAKELLADVYIAQDKVDLAAKYFIMANADGYYSVYSIMYLVPKLSREMQLKVLESVMPIRNTDEYFEEIPQEIRDLFMNKKAEMTRCLSCCLIRDVVGICVAYY